jgi:hypothetical protein
MLPAKRCGSSFQKTGKMLRLKKKQKGPQESAEILTATLRGRGRRETCLVCAVRQAVSESSTTPGPEAFRIRDLPAGLEDGEYQLEVNGIKLTLRVDGSQWQLVGC